MNRCSRMLAMHCKVIFWIWLRNRSIIKTNGSMSVIATWFWILADAQKIHILMHFDTLSLILTVSSLWWFSDFCWCIKILILTQNYAFHRLFCVADWMMSKTKTGGNPSKLEILSTKITSSFMSRELHQKTLDIFLDLAREQHQSKIYRILFNF